jgi:hypothetical protein
MTYKNRKHPGTFQTRDIKYKGRSDQIKDLGRDVMIKGRNESRDVAINDVLNSRGRSDQGRNNIAPRDRMIPTENATSKSQLLFTQSDNFVTVSRGMTSRDENILRGTRQVPE